MANIYPDSVVLSWQQQGVAQKVWQYIVAHPGQSASSIATALGLTVDQVYWAISNPPLSPDGTPQIIHVIPTDDVEFITKHAAKHGT
jgi:hypothetical protein